MSSENVDLVGKKSSHASEMQVKISAELQNIEKNIQEMDKLKKNSIEKLEKQKNELKESTAKSVCDEHYETLKEIAVTGKTIHDRKTSITKLDRTIAELDDQIAKIQAEHDTIVGELELKRRKLNDYLKYYDILNERLEVLLQQLNEEEKKHCEELNNLRQTRSDLLEQTDLSQTALQKKLDELDVRIDNLNKEHDMLIDTISKNLSDIAMEPDIAAEVQELLSKSDEQKEDDKKKGSQEEHEDKSPKYGKASDKETVVLERHQTPRGSHVAVLLDSNGVIIEQRRSPRGTLTEEHRTQSGTILKEPHVISEKEQQERQKSQDQQKSQKAEQHSKTRKEQKEQKDQKPGAKEQVDKTDAIVFENEGRTVSVTLDKQNKKLSLSLDGAPQSLDVKLNVDGKGKMTVDKRELQKLQSAGLLDDPAGIALLESTELNLSELLSEKQIKELQTFEETLQKTKHKQKFNKKILSKDERKYLLSKCLQITPSNRIITKDDKIIHVEDARRLGLLSDWYDGEEDDVSQNQYDISSVKELEEDVASKYKKKLSDTGLYYDLDSESQLSSEKVSIISLLSTQECDYLKQIFGKSLSLALAEIMAVQPADPIHYLAHWFLKYRYNQEIDEVKRLEIQALMIEQERLEAERWHSELQEEARLAILEALFRAENIIIQQDFDRSEIMEEEFEGEFAEEAQH